MFACVSSQSHFELNENRVLLSRDIWDYALWMDHGSHLFTLLISKLVTPTLIFSYLWMHTKQPIGAVISMLGQFAVLPAIGFCLSLLFKLQLYEALGVLIISCCPGGSFSNFFTFWVDGDLALSIMMTVCSSVLAFGGMPFNLWLYGSYWQGDNSFRDNSFVIPFTNIMTSLAIITTLVIVGMTVRYFCKRAAEIITRVSGLIGWVGVIAGFIIWLILYWKIFMMAPPLLYVTAMLLPSTGFIFAFLLAKLTCQNNKIARTIDIETSSQNMSVAISIILLSFTNIEIYKRFCKKQKIPTSTFKPTGTYLC
ncbi:LOW QUALITY PROTEIN: solute carrier family 10 member 6-like [Portunus trituberculatus]|uniref:LOW QUALITY PROTEIN: solute carrier family 10 member 6-like n=1 Tax=Portunus trituberculatus TaxID=210409 RepID=UPI001E1CB04C|nr:LOW QUALITY PROTEIN: solute carrier family 10 member 6-like [Portunus trituberculatus]